MKNTPPASKNYKTFAFPNELTPLEQYHYYLLEFDVIPKRLSAEKIEEIFTHAATDYLEGLLNIGSFTYISFQLMMYYNKGEYAPGLGRLLDYCHELTDRKEEVDRVKSLLDLYLHDRKKFIELYEQNKF